jgi:hypothetical protein
MMYMGLPPTVIITYAVFAFLPFLFLIDWCQKSIVDVVRSRSLLPLRVVL